MIDDEFLNRKLITIMVNKLNPVFDIQGEAENIREGFNLINKVKPDVVFLDIKMPDGSGFDMLKQFDVIDFEVVFITGFDQYALKAFEFNALDYVLKPIDMDKFKVTLDKVQMRVKQNISGFEGLQKIIQSYEFKDAIISKIPVHYHDKVLLLNPDEVMYVQSQDKNAVFTKSTGEKLSSLKVLEDLEFIIESFPDFIRIGEDTFINARFIASYSNGPDSYVTMNDHAIIKVPEAKRQQLSQMLAHKQK